MRERMSHLLHHGVLPGHLIKDGVARAARLVRNRVRARARARARVRLRLRVRVV